MKRLKKKLILLASSVVLCLSMNAQQYKPFQVIRKYTEQRSRNWYDSSMRGVTNRLGSVIHYLYPLYQSIGWEDRFTGKLGKDKFYTSFAESLAFAGDYAMAVDFAKRVQDSLPSGTYRQIADSLNRLKSIQIVPAREAVLSNAAYYQVIMINESRHSPVHRAFTYQVLDELYAKGYRYLALEALNNFSNRVIDSVNVLTGYYTMEPVAGELVRKARRLGFTLVAYEDTLASKHTLSQRDSGQAANLSQILKQDPSAKIIVHATGIHIAETPQEEMLPMAWWLKKITGKDVFTIDQTTYTEASTTAYAQGVYETILDNIDIREAAVLFSNKRPFNFVDQPGYDISIIQPPTTYLHNRPSWLTLGGERETVLIQPGAQQLFFVQAYYESEYDSATLKYLVPADQTYIANRDGYYCLFLRKGRYKIVLRDVSYRIVGIKDREVL